MAKNRKPARRRIQQASSTPPSPGISRRGIILGAAASAVVGAAGYGLHARAGRLGRPAGEAFPEAWQGDPDAPVSMISYVSFTCGHCAEYHVNVWPQLKQDYVETGKVRHLMREVAFDQYGFWAAMVARRGGPSSFYRVSERLLLQQRRWMLEDPKAAQAELVRIAGEAGIVRSVAERALHDIAMAGELRGWIDGNVRRDGIKATPSFIIAGRRYGNMSREGFDQVIRRQLLRA